MPIQGILNHDEWLVGQDRIVFEQHPRDFFADESKQYIRLDLYTINKESQEELLIAIHIIYEDEHYFGVLHSYYSYDLEDLDGSEW